MRLGEAHLPDEEPDRHQAKYGGEDHRVAGPDHGACQHRRGERVDERERQLPGLQLSVHAADEWGNDEHALAIARRIVGNLNRRKLPQGHTANQGLEVAPGPAKPPRYDPRELYGVIPTDTRKPYDIREVIARIVDDSWLDEWKARCPSCYLRRRSRLRGRDHEIEDCTAGETRSILARRNSLTSRLNQGQGGIDLAWCLVCFLPHEWHQKNGVLSVDEHMPFSTGCEYRGVLTSTLAALLCDHFFSETIFDWFEESKFLGGLDKWLGTAIQWGNFIVPIIVKVFYKLTEYVRLYREW